MSTYLDYKKQIAELRAKAEEARRSEVVGAKAKILAIMAEYGLTADDLSGNVKRRSILKRRAAEPKYRNSETGQTWSGRGRTPKWLVDKDKNQFLI